MKTLVGWGGGAQIIDRDTDKIAGHEPSRRAYFDYERQQQ